MFRDLTRIAALRGLTTALVLAFGSAHAAPVVTRENPPPLRVVVLPDAPSSVQTSQAARMLEDFARSEGRKVEWSVATHPAELFARLTTYRADLVVGALPSELAGNPRLAATSTVATERYVVVGRNTNPARSPLDLHDMNVAVSRRTPLWDYFNALQAAVPGMQFETRGRNLTRAESLRLVAEGSADVAVVAVGADSSWKREQPNLRVLFDLTGDEPVNWYARREDAPLREALNAFIERFHTAYLEPTAAAPRNLRAILNSRVLRVITRVERPNYYIEGGTPKGFEYEMARGFAEQHGLRLEVLVAHDEEQMRDWLHQGMGDLISARVAPDSTGGDGIFSASRHYHYTAYVPVSRDALNFQAPGVLATKRISVVQDSPEWRALRSLNRDEPGPNVLAVDPTVATDTLLKQVAAGLLDATVVSAEDAVAVKIRYPTLKLGTSLPHRYDYRWLVRDNDPKLLEAIDQFLVASQTDGRETMLAARYFDNPNSARAVAGRPGRLSPFDPIVQRYAERYGFDWRLIAAQMYQESQFDPAATSRSGAMGLMQLLPSTAESLGFANLGRPESSIHAGVKYLYTLRNEFDDQVPVGERTWFALAAYNMGSQRVEKAREVATRLGLDPNRWTGNVEKAMLSLARSATRHGDPRYGQGIIYVRSIQLLYGSYRNGLALSSLRLAGTPSA